MIALRQTKPLIIAPSHSEQPTQISAITTILSCPGAPKVTVTRKGDSLCQKGCYPMALLFLFLFLWSLYVVWWSIAS
jgi:hypothetical protein